MQRPSHLPLHQSAALSLQHLIVLILCMLTSAILMRIRKLVCAYVWTYLQPYEASQFLREYLQSHGQDRGRREFLPELLRAIEATLNTCHQLLGYF